MKVLKNVNAYVYNKGIVKTDIAFENGKISFIGDYNGNGEVITLPENAVVLPGFIDQHVHGSATCDAMDGSCDNLKTIAKSLASEGTVGFLATTMTQSVENITNALNSVKQYKSVSQPEGAEVLGVHLEGPFICPSKVGAQPLEHVQKPQITTFENYNKASGNNIKIVTLAPEEDGADQLIEYLSKNNIVASVGHTNATCEQVKRAGDFGASNITHTYNAQRGFSHREAGVVGCAFLDDRFNCEIICDTIHVSVPSIKLLIKNKPHDKVTLITDAMRAKNMGDCVSELGGQTVYVKNGEARLEDGTLAGSVLRMNDAIKNVVTKCGVSLTDAVDFASSNPAKNLGVFDRLGSIEVGKDASFAILDSENFEVLSTIRAGEYVYNK